MIFLVGNKVQRLIYSKFHGTVTAKDFRDSDAVRSSLINEVGRNFRFLSDLSELESMDDSCTEELARVMDELKAGGIEMVVRIIPDPRKDIGLNILSVFHYGRKVRTVTCTTFAEAMKALKL
jgi:anti-anti-sigma regulatory factor